MGADPVLMTRRLPRGPWSWVHRVGGQGGVAGPYCCCSSFILFRALPARNHSIWVSLKVWFRRMVSCVPLGCLMMHFRG